MCVWVGGGCSFDCHLSKNYICKNICIPLIRIKYNSTKKTCIFNEDSEFSFPVNKNVQATLKIIYVCRAFLNSVKIPICLDAIFAGNENSEFLFKNVSIFR